jgi:hypothetical protein
MQVIGLPNEVLTLVKTKTALHYLRGFDSIHLSAALFVKNLLHLNGLIFSCYDHQLNTAAEKEGLSINKVKHS